MQPNYLLKRMAISRKQVNSETYFDWRVQFKPWIKRKYICTVCSEIMAKKFKIYYRLRNKCVIPNKLFDDQVNLWMKRSDCIWQITWFNRGVTCHKSCNSVSGIWIAGEERDTRSTRRCKEAAQHDLTWFNRILRSTYGTTRNTQRERERERGRAIRRENVCEDESKSSTRDSRRR